MTTVFGLRRRRFRTHCAANNPPQIVRSLLSNSMLGSGQTTPQDYPEWTGFGRRREREWGHGGTAAGSIRSTYSCASISSGTTELRCAARRRRQSMTAKLPLHRMRRRAAPLSAKRLLALWNALPGVEKRKKVGDRDAL